MAASQILGQFFVTGDVSQAALVASICFSNRSDSDEKIIRNIVKNGWDEEEQVISNLLQSPFLLPEDIRLSTIIKGLEDDEMPYFILSACIGIQRVKLKDDDLESLEKLLRKAVFNEHGAVCMRAFITLNPFLKYPKDNQLFIDILSTKKSPLHETALSWLVLHVSDKQELLKLLNDGHVKDSLVTDAVKKIDDHCQSLAHGEESPVTIEVFDYVPNMIDFEAMLDKEDALTEFFDDLDTDHDEKLSAKEVQTFLEDIGKEVKIDDVIEEMKKIGIDDGGKIDRDGFMEMMFPKFQIH
eukprot:TCONS_00054975-protein